MAIEKEPWWIPGGNADRLIIYSFLLFTVVFTPVMAIAGIVAMIKGGS